MTSEMIDVWFRRCAEDAVANMTFAEWRRKAEEPLIREALRRTGFNLVHTARLLGTARNTVYKKIKEYKIKPEELGITWTVSDRPRMGRGRKLQDEGFPEDTEDGPPGSLW